MSDEKGLSLASIDDVTRLAGIAVASRLTKLSRVEEAAVILMTGRELGLAPMQSLRGIYVVDGKPTLSADMMVAVVRRSGLCESWRTVESTPERCTITTRRKGETSDATRTWTRADAERAGVTGKDPWRKYPAAMLRHRCAADLAREVYPDVLLGLYDPDEMDAAPTAAEVVPSLESIGIENDLRRARTIPAPASSWAADLEQCATLREVRTAYAVAVRVSPDGSAAMRDDVRAWLADRGVPGVTGAEATAILSTLPEAALAVLSDLWCDEESAVTDRCVTAARAIHRAEWDEHSRRTAHTVTVRCYAHATDAADLRSAGAALVALRDAADTSAESPAPADEVADDVRAELAAVVEQLCAVAPDVGAKVRAACTDAPDARVAEYLNRARTLLNEHTPRNAND